MLGNLVLPISGLHTILINNGESRKTIAIARIRYVPVLFLSFVTVAFDDRHCHRHELLCDIKVALASRHIFPYAYPR